MNAHTLLRFALLAFCLCAPPSRAAAPPRPAAAQTLAILGVTVIDVTGGDPKTNQTVLIQGGRVVALGRNVVAPPGSRTLDGRGKFLIPGLWDMHAHAVDDSFRDLFLAHGVTGVRHMYSFSRWYSPRPWRKPTRGDRPAPRLVLSDSMVDGARPAMPWLLRANVHAAADARSARLAVRACKQRQEDFVKVYPGLSREAFLALLEEAGALGLPVAGHVPHAVNVGEAADKGMRSVEHLSGVALACSRREQALRAALVRDTQTGALQGMDAATAWRTQVQAYNSYDPGKAAALFARFARKGTWHTPTLVQKRAWGRLGEPGFTADPRLPTLTAWVRELWRVERTPDGVLLPGPEIRFTGAELVAHRRQFRKDMEVVEAMHKAGVRLLAGTDAPSPYSFPGSGLHDELELLVEAGLSPLDALRTATRNPAVFLGREKDLGAVEVGKLADLVLLDADPLKHIGNTRRIAAVLVGGRVLVPGTARPADPTRREGRR
jgi:imidazolonepropionase-like amidohydrolase